MGFTEMSSIINSNVVKAFLYLDIHLFFEMKSKYECFRITL